MRKAFFSSLTSTVAFMGLLLLPASQVSAAVNYNRLIDDPVFSKSSSMSASQIDSFLNSFSSSCISSSNGFKAPEPIGYTPSGGFKFGNNVTAGQVIYVASKSYGLNPQVILSTLQKEKSLVSGGAGCYPNNPNPSWPKSNSPSSGHTFDCNIGGQTVTCTYACPYNGGCINIAVGYGCPGYCNAAQEGFSNQIIRASWKLKFNQQRSLGNTSWNVQLNNFPHSGNTWDNSDDPGTCYSGPMTQGYRKRCSSNPSATYYDGYTTLNDGNSVHVDTGGTASLYYYTPFKSGNLSFFNIFSDWFGNPSADTSKDKPLVGDWNNSNKDSSGARRATTYFLDNNNDCQEDDTIAWGRSSDQSIIGDFNGDGNDDLGLKRSTIYYLDYDKNGSPNKLVNWGRSSDSVIIGDWNGDGKTDLGLRRGTTYFMDYNLDGRPDATVNWGRSTDMAVVGDWDGNGSVTLGLKRSNYYFLDNNNDGGSDKSFFYTY
jgi:hypothetical protein